MSELDGIENRPTGFCDCDRLPELFDDVLRFERVICAYPKMKRLTVIVIPFLYGAASEGVDKNLLDRPFCAATAMNEIGRFYKRPLIFERQVFVVPVDVEFIREFVELGIR